MKTRIFSILFILASLATGCVSEFNAKLTSDEQQILIVDGNIIGNSNVTFYLSKSYSMDSTYASSDIFDVNAKIIITGSDGYKSSPAINQGNGKYSIDVGTLDDNVKYGIQIEYDGDTYQSTLSTPVYTPEIDSISWVQPEQNGAIHFRVSTHDDETEEAKFFLWDYAETWEIAADYYTLIFLDLQTNKFYSIAPAPYYYCWRNDASNSYMVGSTESLTENSIINKEIYQGDPQDDRFSILYSVLVNQKAISKAAYDYYQNKIKLNEQMGGLFSPQPSEVSGNIICTTNPSKRAMGYVEVCKNTTQKRIFVSRFQITRPSIYNNCQTITNDSVLIRLSEMNGTYVDFYNLGYRPAGDFSPFNRTLPAEWAIKYCTDCVANGGSKEKPDFWPNDDK